MKVFFSYFLLLLRLGLGGLFAYSGYLKIMDPLFFKYAIESYQIVPAYFTTFLAFFIPMLELILGSMLILGIWLNISWPMYLGLLLVFDMAIINAYVNDLEIICGCFGEGVPKGVDAMKLLENFLLTIGAGIGWWSLDKFKQIGSLID